MYIFVFRLAKICIVQGTAAGKVRRPAAQSKPRELRPRARAACFEELAGVFASSGALHYAKIFERLKIKKGISMTPQNCALNTFTFALDDSADDWLNDYQSISGWSDSYS